MSRMFPFITKTLNPLGGECQHRCCYCWARKLAERYHHRKYMGKPRIMPKILAKALAFGKEDFVFICDMVDLFGSWVPSKLIKQVLEGIGQSPATFLLLTKNPERYRDFRIPSNCVCGATIECDMDFKITGQAPTPYQRIHAMSSLRHPRKMVSIEPIMNFTPSFLFSIANINPEFVAVGYDNYRNNLPEPSLEMAEILIRGLETRGIKVYRKTLRERKKIEVFVA